MTLLLMIYLPSRGDRRVLQSARVRRRVEQGWHFVEALASFQGEPPGSRGGLRAPEQEKINIQLQ